MFLNQIIYKTRIFTKFFATIVLFFLIICICPAQEYPYEKIEHYDFVRYDINRLEFFGDSLKYNRLFQKLDSLVMQGKGKINIVHFGGSHIQAGALPGHFADRLQHFYPGLKGSRGYVFPFAMARTNNPHNYYTKHTGNWQTCRNVERHRSCKLGVSGIMASTEDSTATIEIHLVESDYPDYEFNRIKILHDTDSLSYRIIPKDCKQKYTVTRYDSLGYTCIELEKHVEKITLQLQKTDSTQYHFRLYGILLDTSEPGIFYHGFGVNGASIPCILRCQLFEEHLKIVNPDWVILTLGTNDAYSRKFNPDYFYANYDSLLSKIKNAAPQAQILMTVANDSYLYRRYPNRNTVKTGEVIKKLAPKYHAAVWDFYHIMGGYRSINLWIRKGLATRDKIHFTKRGYFLQADLLFNAFLHSYDRYLKNKVK